MEGVNVLRETVIASIHHRGGRRVFSKPLTLGLHAPAALRRPGLDRTHTNPHRAQLFTGSSPKQRIISIIRRASTIMEKHFTSAARVHSICSPKAYGHICIYIYKNSCACTGTRSMFCFDILPEHILLLMATSLISAASLRNTRNPLHQP